MATKRKPASKTRLPSITRRVVSYDLTDEERAAVEKAAEADHRSVSSWIAQAVRAALVR